MPTLDPERYPPVRFGPDASGPTPPGRATRPEVYRDRHCELCTGLVWRVAGQGLAFLTREGAEEWINDQIATQGGKP